MKKAEKRQETRIIPPLVVLLVIGEFDNKERFVPAQTRRRPRGILRRKCVPISPERGCLANGQRAPDAVADRQAGRRASIARSCTLVFLNPRF